MASPDWANTILAISFSLKGNQCSRHGEQQFSCSEQRSSQEHLAAAVQQYMYGSALVGLTGTLAGSLTEFAVERVLTGPI